MKRVSIKGFELRNIVCFKGHEEEDLQQGDIYYKGKRIGWYSQDAWSGEDIIHLDNGYVEFTEKTAKEYLKTRFKEEFLQKMDTFFLEILELNNNFKFFLAEKKKGMEFIAIVSNEIGGWCSERVYAFRNKKALEDLLEKDKLVLVKKFSTEEDFVIA